MNPKITVRNEFDYGHRLMKHEGKCSSYHGHRGVLLTTIGCGRLDSLGMVSDFGDIGLVIRRWLAAHWDHVMLVEAGDPFIDFCRNTNWKMGVTPRCYVTDGPPTAELLAKKAFEEINKILDETQGLYVHQIIFFETPNYSAEYP